MAGVTRKEFDELSRRVKAIEDAGRGAPEPEPGVPTTTAEGVTLSAPTATVDGASYTLTGTVTASSRLQLTYLQLAVRGPGAQDLAFMPHTTLEAGQPVTLTATATGEPGAYTARIAYSVDGAAWADGPMTAFEIDKSAVPAVTPESVRTGERRVPLVRRSGLPFNSIVFRQEPGGAEQFGNWRGVPVDGLLWFTTRGTWGDFRNVRHWSGKADWLEAKRLVVTSLPHAPTSEGDVMNDRGANNAYQQQQRELGKWFADNGLNSPYHVIRVDWECNGNWYNWSANRPGGAGALRTAIINFVTNVRAGGGTQLRFDLCWNKGPSQSGADYSIFPGAEFVDVVGVDQYDMWGPSFNDAQWNTEINKSPGLANLAAFARKHGILWSLDEGGNTHGGGAMGGDNPFYWEKLWKFCVENADTCAWMNTYDHAGAPATLRHDFTSNPRSAGTYKRLWRPQ